MPPLSRQSSRRQPTPAPTLTLSAIVQEHEIWRGAQNGQASRAALRDYWRKQDSQYGARPDYQLWRHTQCSDSPPEKRQSLEQVIQRGLEHKETLVQWATLSLMPSLLLAEDTCIHDEKIMRLLDDKLNRQALPAAPHSSALALWLCRAALAGDPSTLLLELQKIFIKARPEWKCGRSISLNFLQEEGLLPISQQTSLRLLVAVITKLIHILSHTPSTTPQQLIEVTPWCMSSWQLLKELRPSKNTTSILEVELLLNTAATLRCAGLTAESSRLTCLALHLIPERAPAALIQRCRVGAWSLAETGLATPQSLRVSLDDLPFPGEPPQSEKGQELARLFRDDEDAFQARLLREVSEDPDWCCLKAVGVALTHPLAALAWVGKKAQSYALKKQHELLQSASRLALRHQSLVTLGRILTQWPDSAEKLLSYASALRESQRRMPLLRDSSNWLNCTQSLRAAWGKLEAEAVTEEEMIFMLHETLLDREVTLSRSLPIELRALSLRHLHSRRAPSLLVQALQADPRLMQQLEHKSAIELWSISAEIRERPELAQTVWISVVTKGDATSGKYSWIVQSSTGRRMKQGRLRAGDNEEKADQRNLVQEIAEAVHQLGIHFDWVLLAADANLTNLPWQSRFVQEGLTARVSFIPSWEWAFRSLRETETAKDIDFEALAPAADIEQRSPMTVNGLMAQACLLVPGPDSSDGTTKWTVCGKPYSDANTRRSLSIGRHPMVFSEGPLTAGSFSTDLVRLCLAQSSKLIVSALRPLNNSEREAFELEIFAIPSGVSLSSRLKTLDLDLWQIQGIPW